MSCKAEKISSINIFTIFSEPFKF